MYCYSPFHRQDLGDHPVTSAPCRGNLDRVNNDHVNRCVFFLLLVTHIVGNSGHFTSKFNLITLLSGWCIYRFAHFSAPCLHKCGCLHIWGQNLVYKSVVVCTFYSSTGPCKFVNLYTYFIHSISSQLYFIILYCYSPFHRQELGDHPLTLAPCRGNHDRVDNDRVNRCVFYLLLVAQIVGNSGRAVIAKPSIDKTVDKSLFWPLSDISIRSLCLSIIHASRMSTFLMRRH